MKQYFLILISLIILQSCSSTKTEEQVQNGDSLSSQSDSIALAQEIKVFSLPAPLQIPYEIKKLNPRYYEDLLKPSNSNPENIANNYKKALNLGVYAVDLGYTTTYDQGQAAINYLSTCIKLAEQLNITTSVNANLIERYKKNLSNRDSLNSLIIKSFAEINRTLSESNRQADAALILTGSFIEGVHLSTAIYNRNKTDLMINLIGQQKLFLDNLLEILPNYQSNDIIKLVANLRDLKSDYDSIEIKYSDSKENDQQVIEKIVATESQISEIARKIKGMRDEIIS